ncbi:MAG: GTPase, partial [Cyanobacteria bacterium P01_A01_bin.135]
MVKLSRWQWVALVAPIALLVGFVLFAAGWQIQRWGISWVWALIVLGLVGWRWLLARWTKPATITTSLLDEAAAEVAGESDAVLTILDELLIEAQGDPPLWEDWELFWRRCQSLVTAIAQLYYPDTEYPLLNIYVPEAYGLIRGTVDDVDRWMQQLSPMLGQVTVGQAYQGFRWYQKLEPRARKLRQAWGWLQWVTNPAVAVARQASQPYSQRANQELLGNLGQMLREVALRNLAQQTAALYGDRPVALEAERPGPVPQQSATLKTILEQAEPVESIARSPLNIWVMGRTGAGKSSLINSLFATDRAEVDLLPSTAEARSYRWQTPLKEEVQLWDTPGYEQANQLDSDAIFTTTALDVVLLVTPATDPALQMDADRLAELLGYHASNPPPAIAVVTQVDRLRPVREWSPPYDWQTGDRPKEVSIRAAAEYRAEHLPCQQVIPLVTRGDDRQTWNLQALSEGLLQVVDPAKRLRLARALQSQATKATAAAQVIQRYCDRMATAQGLTALLKSPVLSYISTLST